MNSRIYSDALRAISYVPFVLLLSACASSTTSQRGETLHDQATVHFREGRYTEAERLYKDALKSDEKTLGSDHPDMAMTLNNLALVYKTQGQYAEAEPLYERALAILEKSSGKESSSVAISVSNLALLYQTQAKYS